MLYILTLDEAKTELELTDAVNDIQLTTHMEQLQGRFEEYLNRQLCRAEDVVEINDGGARAVLLSRFPVESVKQVMVASLSLDPQMYTVHQDRGRVIYNPSGSPNAVWPVGEQNITVTYTGGFVPAGSVAAAGQYTMPEAIRGAFRIQLNYEWRNRRILGQNSVSAQGSSVTLAPAKMLVVVTEAIGHFRRF
jgi:hypothetical protein